MKTYSKFTVVIYVLLIALFAKPILADDPLVERYLRTGELKEGERQLKRYLAGNPDDDRVRFELGMLQFLQTVEHLGQSLYQYGNTSDFDFLPILRFPVPDNPRPEPFAYEDSREILETIIRDLNRADATLARVKDPSVELPLHIFKFHMDWNQNDEIDDEEELSTVYEQYLGRRFSDNKYRNKVVVFDKADVHWVRGYCSLLRGMCEFLLAYDQRAIWDVSAHRFSQTPRSSTILFSKK